MSVRLTRQQLRGTFPDTTGVFTAQVPVVVQEELSALDDAGGQAGELARLKHHKAEIERMTARYKKLIRRNQPIRDSSEMGLLAEKLGRPVEARV